MKESGEWLLAVLVGNIAVYSLSDTVNPASFIRWRFFKNVFQRVVAIVLIFGWKGSRMAVESGDFCIDSCSLDACCFLILSV